MYMKVLGTQNSLQKWSSLLPGLSFKTGILWNSNKTSLERSGWVQASLGLNQQVRLGWVSLGLAKSFVFHYTICILVKQVCTVLWLHFHCSWELSAKSEKEAFVLPLSLPSFFLEVCPRSLTPMGETFSLLPSPPWLRFTCLVTLRGAELGSYSTTFRTKRSF